MTKKNLNFIFDLDGVIFDSRSNMQISWKKTCSRFELKKSFKEYFKNIGIPFDEILKNIGIKKILKKLNQNIKKTL